MEQHVCMIVCLTILALTGGFDGALSAAGLFRRDAAYPLICMALLSGFNIKLAEEFNIDIASLVLPNVFFLLSIGAPGARAGSLRLLSLAALLPIAVRAASALVELLSSGYAAFILGAPEFCPAELACSALALLLISIKRKAKRKIKAR